MCYGLYGLYGRRCPGCLTICRSKPTMLLDSANLRFTGAPREEEEEQRIPTKRIMGPTLDSHTKYMGYLDLLQFIEFQPNLDRTVLLKQGFPLDYTFLLSSSSWSGCETETLLLTCLDTLFILSLNRMRNRWEVINKVQPLSGIDIGFQKDV